MNDRAQSSVEAGRVLHGVGVSPGVAIGPAHVVSDVTIHVPSRAIKESEVRGEIARFEKALIATRSQIREIVKNLGDGTGETGVLDAHLMVLDDRMLIDDVVRGIHDGLQNAEA
ncbi:MAG: phosphoenolpyruvate--protein phosphotransferase, partial [Lentisphaerae bacterium]|nr:phosphoenolpyruvate--protein phosphotransferase [Lentisphaerota bacterium]